MTSNTSSAGLCRVAYLINQYPKVSHTFIRREIHALERQGVDVTRIAIRGWKEPLADAADEAERTRTHYLLRRGIGGLVVPVLRTLLRAPGRFVSALKLTFGAWRASDRALPYHLAYLAEACAVLELAREERVDHLHAHFGTNSASVAMLAHALGGPPFSFTVHGPEEFDKPQSLGLGAKVAHSAFAVAISSFGRSQLFRWTPSAHWHKVEVVHCGLEPGFHAHAHDDPPERARLVCVGRLCEQKAQLLLVRAAAELARAGVDFELVLAGDGELRGAIESLVDSLGLQGKVRITGWISSDRVREEITAARALVLPSFAEGLPVVIMEAMALRRPVVSTYVAGIPELVRDGVEGWLCPAGDLDSLVQALRSCLDASAQELSRLGTAARTRVLERHDVDVEAARLSRLFSRSAGTAGLA